MFGNGIPGNLNESEQRFCNGSGCFALQLVAEEKEGAGGLYATTPDASEGYDYEIEFHYIDDSCDIKEIKITSSEEDEEFNQTYVIKREEDNNITKIGVPK